MTKTRSSRNLKQYQTDMTSGKATVVVEKAQRREKDRDKQAVSRGTGKGCVDDRRTAFDDGNKNIKNDRA